MLNKYVCNRCRIIGQYELCGQCRYRYLNELNAIGVLIFTKLKELNDAPVTFSQSETGKKFSKKVSYA